MGPTQSPKQAPTRDAASPVPEKPRTASAPGTPAQAPEPERSGRHLWLGLIPGMVAVAIMLVFLFENLQETTVSFLGLSGDVPLGLALVAAALLGGVIVFGFGSVRILQLRKLAKGKGRRP